MSKLEDFYTVTQVADLLHVTRRQVIKMIDRCRFPGAYQLEKTRTSPWRIPVSSYQAFIDSIEKKGDKKPDQPTHG